MEIPAREERPFATPADSEMFYRTALLGKLLSSLETSLSGVNETNISNQTLNLTQQTNASNMTLLNTSLPQNSREEKRTFSLKKLLANAVYPEECSQHNTLVNASFIENHLSNQSIFKNTIVKNGPESDYNSENTLTGSDADFLNDTVVDEELVMNLTQSQHVPLNASCK